MKGLIEITTKTTNRVADTEKILKEYYRNFFSLFNPTELFEIYDMSKERFVAFPGKEGSRVVNRDTLVKNLAEMEANCANVDNLLIIQYDKEDIDFNEPVFIGKVDIFYSQNN